MDIPNYLTRPEYIFRPTQIYKRLLRPKSQHTNKVVKIDVEGHELSVLFGAKRLINEGRICDIIFEDNRKYPTTVTQFLENNGYQIFQIAKGLWKPLLQLPTNNNKIQYWESQSYLATKDAARAKSRLSQKRWRSLSKQSLS